MKNYLKRDGLILVGETLGVVRKHYYLDEFVYFATKRGKRPKEFVKTSIAASSKKDIFGVGQENLTPPEIGRIEHKNKWLMRWIPNKFPAVQQKGNAKWKGSSLFRETSNLGYHEVIIETQDQKTQLGDLTIDHISLLLQVYAQRITQLSKKKHIQYVQVFKNHGSEAGTSIIHEHSQLVALSLIPPTVKKKIAAIKKLKRDPYTSIIRNEMKSKRRIKATKNFVSFCPFASKFNYEAWIVPKQPLRDFEEFSESDYKDLATHLKHIIQKLQSINASYNYYVVYAPKAERLRFHIEITPRLATWAGFELGSGCIINSVFPEDAASFYRSR